MVLHMHLRQMLASVMLLMWATSTAQGQLLGQAGDGGRSSMILAPRECTSGIANWSLQMLCVTRAGGHVQRDFKGATLHPAAVHAAPQM